MRGWYDRRASGEDGLAKARKRMLRRHLAGRGIRDRAVIEAMGAVPREEFVPREHMFRAYGDGPLPIGMGQTISQPYVVAWMAEALELGPRDRVLEIGTGSGYAAAVLGLLCEAVYTVERHLSLADAAGARLHALRFGNVHVRHGDGGEGWAEHAPYDAIVVAAAGLRVPEPLRAQLRVGGRLVMPVGGAARGQVLVRERLGRGGRITREELGLVRFVPLVLSGE